MPFLDILEGLSPWWWVALAFALGAVEMATGTYLLLWVSLAAFQMAALMWLAPGLSGEVQVVTFAALAVATTFIGRWALLRFGDGGQEHATLNQRSNHLVGRTATVLEAEPGRGSVEVDGMRWRASWPEGETGVPGTRVQVTAAAGMELRVRNL